MVKKSWLLAFSLALALAFAFPANATVINFDSLNDVDNPYYGIKFLGYGFIPSNYQGFNWGDADNPWDFFTQAYYQGFGNSTTFPTAQNAGSPENGAGRVTSSTAFNCVSAYFSTFAINNGFGDIPTVGSSAEKLTITGYRNGSQVGEPVEVDLTTSLVWTSVNLANVDTLVFQPGPEGQFAWFMDNFEYIEDPAPLPPTVLLLGSGLVGLGFLGRRKFRKA